MPNWLKKGEVKERKIFITFEAIYDIADAEEYILYAFGEKRAEEYHHAIYEELYKLKSDIVSYMPSGFKYRKYTIYKKPFKPAIIFLDY